jgi:TRAP-type transport system periplasmic protein
MPFNIYNNYSPRSKYKIKKRRVLLMKKLCVILLVAFFMAYGFSNVQAVELKLAHYAAETHEGHLASKMFAEAVEKRTNGAITIKIFPNNQLGQPPEVLEQNVMGAVDMTLPSQGQLAKYVKKFNCVMLPFAFKDYAQVDRVIDGKAFQNWVNPDLEKAGLVFLGNWEWGFRNLTTTKKLVKVPDDVKGLKIRTPPELPTQVAMQSLGATVQTIAFGELVMALTQGVVDGQENPISVIYSNKLYETQKFLCMTGHNYGSMINVINKKTWDKLTIAQQVILKEESVKAGNWMRTTLRANETKQIEELKKLGVTVVVPDKAPFKKAVQYDKLYDACGGKENIDYFLKLVK